MTARFAHRFVLVIQEPAFDRKASGVTCQVAVSADHSVTGNHDGQWIGALCSTHGPHGVRITQFTRNILITGGAAERDVCNPLPHRELERRPCRLDRKRKSGKPAGEVRFYLSGGFAQDGVHSRLS